MQKDPKIGVVILNYNGLKDTLECLESITKITYSNFETIVVDNGSKENPLSAIKENYSKVITILNNDNLGFAEGSNIGIRKALDINCEYILLLNNDTTVDSNILSSFNSAIKKRPEAGIFGAKILRYDSPNIIDHIGGEWNKQKAEFISYGAGKEISDLNHNTMKNVDYVCGCCMLIKKEVIDSIGLLEKDFFLLWEESDFCFRAKKAGYEIWTVPDSHVWHKISVSFTGGTIHSDYYWWRNRLLWIKRNLSLSERVKTYINIITPEIFKLYKLNFLKSLQFKALIFLNKNKVTEKKALKLIRYKACVKGILDYFLTNLGEGPEWITNPKTHKTYVSFLKINSK